MRPAALVRFHRRFHLSAPEHRPKGAPKPQPRTVQRSPGAGAEGYIGRQGLIDEGDLDLAANLHVDVDVVFGGASVFVMAVSFAILQVWVFRPRQS